MNMNWGNVLAATTYTDHAVSENDGVTITTPTAGARQTIQPDGTYRAQLALSIVGRVLAPAYDYDLGCRCDHHQTRPHNAHR
jgi:hypothetical protein